MRPTVQSQGGGVNVENGPARHAVSRQRSFQRMLAALIAAALAIGTFFPHVEARDLTGKTRSPADLQGAPAAIVLAMGRGSSSGVRPWQEFASEASGGHLRVVECLVFYKSNQWMRPLAETLMARRRPRDRWDDVWTTGEGDRLARELGLRNSDGDVAVAVLDPGGRVVELVHGNPTPERCKAVRTAWEKVVRP